MTPTTKTVFDRFEIRKTKQQKTAFISYVEDVAEEAGYAHRVEGKRSVRNIIIGNPDTAHVVYTAHYDTCAWMPFPNFITPKNFFLYLLYQLMLVAIIGGISIGVGLGVSSLLAVFSLPGEISRTIGYWTGLAVYFGILILMMAGPANKHTANDNTSGVTTLLDLMHAMPDDLRGQVAFVFFDLEEAGLVGSSLFAKTHKSAMRDKLLINFDCVSDGSHMLFVLKKKMAQYVPLMEEAFPPTETIDAMVATHGVFYPSDQKNFPLGVGVASLKKTKRGNLLYMDRIHTARDTVYQDENIAYLVEGSVRLAELVTKKPSHT